MDILQIFICGIFIGIFFGAIIAALFNNFKKLK